MSNKYDQKLGGANIIPSARRGIHERTNNNSFKLQETMGRKGLSDSDEEQLGVDEVDNAQSKFKQSPVKPIKKSGSKCYNQNLRHNSIDASSFQSHESDAVKENRTIISKSLPTSLQCSTCSNEFGLNYTSSSDSSLDPSPVKPQNDFPESSFTLRNNKVRNLYNGNYQTPPHQKDDGFRILLIILAAVLCIVAVYTMLTGGTSQANNFNYDEFKFYNDMDILRSKYQISRDSIIQVQSGISAIYEREDTGSFVFIYDSNAENFKTEKLDLILDDISSSAAKYLRNDTLPVKHLEVTASNLHMSTHGELINQYREVVSRTGVMLVKNVDRVPSTLAMAFHYYCDEFNPLVKRSAIFFTLDLAKCYDRSAHKTTHTKVEKCLAKKWSGVPEDNIRPLLTRVVGVVIDLSNVF